MKKEKSKHQVEEPVSSYKKPLNAEEIWSLFLETDKRFKETSRQFKETDRQFKETDRRFKETDRQFKETDKKIKELTYLFTSQWGKLVESLVEGDLVRLLTARNIEVQRTIQNIEGTFQGRNYEFDIIAVNGREIVIVEVKTTLRPDDVKNFIDKLNHAKIWLHEYRDKTIYGAVAYLKAQAGSAAMAVNKGLFAIRATGNSAHLINDADFEPKAF